MRLRVRAKDLSIKILLNTVVLPELPDWVIELPDLLPDAFKGKALLIVGAAEVVIGWDFLSGSVAILMDRLRSDDELDSASTWGPSTFVAWVHGNETTADGLIGIMVER